MPSWIDRRLFLPEECAGDHDRREQAENPAGVIFRTRPAPALEMYGSADASWGENEPGMSMPEVRTLLFHHLEVRVGDVNAVPGWFQ